MIQDLQHGAASIMDHTERYSIVSQLQKIGAASNLVLSDPAYYADERVDWQRVKLWMNQHTVPGVVAADGDVTDIDGVPCEPIVSELLGEILRVMF